MFILSPKETFSLKKIILNNKQKTLYRNRQWNNLQITHINNYNEKHFPLLFCNNGTSMYCFDMISAFYSAEEVYYKDFWTLRFNAGVTLRPASKNICSLPAVGNFFFFKLNWPLLFFKRLEFNFKYGFRHYLLSLDRFLL